MTPPDEEFLYHMSRALKLSGHVSKDLAPYLYPANPALGPYLAKMAAFRALLKPNKIQKQAAGYLMEQICFIAFKTLRGAGEPESYAAVTFDGVRIVQPFSGRVQ